MDDYKKYEAKCNKIREKNAVLLNEFREHLEEANLSDKVITGHVSSIEFFINTYLLKYEPTEAKNGISHVDGFLGDWFIRKALWSSKSSIKAYAASLKKFYRFMLEKKHLSEAKFNVLKNLIKFEMEDWLAALERSENSSFGEDGY